MLKKIIFYISLQIVAIFPLYAEVYVFNTDSDKVFYKSVNSKISNRFMLNNTTIMPSYLHNIFIDFDDNMLDKTGSHIVEFTDDIKYVEGMNNGKAIFLSRQDSRVMINMVPENATFFNNNFSGSFTVEFYLKPFKENLNATVLDFIAIYREDGEIKNTSISATIYGGKLVWDFSVFFKRGDDFINVAMQKGSYIKIGEWSHHSVSFDATTGRLVKYLNGLEEEVVYVTTSGQNYGGVFTPYLPANTSVPLYLGGGFLGAIDSFSMITEYKRNFDLTVFNPSGEIVSDIIKINDDNAYLESINLDSLADNGTDVMLYYRSSERYFLASDNRIEWKHINSKEDLNYLNFKYIQVKAVLLSDATRKYTPILNSINIVYDILEKPAPPTSFKVRPMNGAVELTWESVHNNSAAGYKIYYSTKPGVYNEFNDVPIIVGNEKKCVIDNLENGKLYYFNITSFGALSEDLESEFSGEIYARPTAK